MGKGNMFLGQVRGSVGDVTFWVGNGQQISRVRRRVIGNPRSTGQQIQRMIFATVAAAYSRLKSITDHSFEGVKYGANSQARFMSENLKRLRAFYPQSSSPNNRPVDTMAFALPNDVAMAGAGLVIARGSIPAPAVTVDNNGVLQGFGSGADEEHSVEGVLNGLGAQAGDQLTVCALRSVGQGYAFSKSRYVVRADATQGELEDPWDPTGSSTVFDQEKTDVNPNATIVVGDIGLGNPISVSNDKDDVVAAAIIISRKEGDKWLRSDAILYNATDEAAFYSAAYALPYWEMSGTDIETLDKRYLNNADV